jgi:hypothetical protein
MGLNHTKKAFAQQKKQSLNLRDWEKIFARYSSDKG